MNTPKRAFSTTLFAALLALAQPVTCAAEERYASLALQNDFLVGRDGGGYTSGIFGSILRVASPMEAGVAPSVLFAPLDAWLGLPRPTLVVSQLGQAIVTPADISRAVPDPADAPYVGALMFRAAQVYAKDDLADMLSLEIGVIGPASGAAQTQRLVHRLTGSTRPEGWDTQVSNRLLLSLEGARAKRFAFGEAGDTGKAQADVVVVGTARAGSLQSSAGIGALLRYGTGLARSLPTAMRLNGLNSSPFAIGRGWFVFGGVSTDYLLDHTGIGSASAANSAQLRKLQVAARAGVSYGTAKSSITFALVSASPLVESSNARQGYGSITYTHALR